MKALELRDGVRAAGITLAEPEWYPATHTRAGGALGQAYRDRERGSELLSTGGVDL